MPIPAGYSETIITPKASRNVEAHWSFTATKTGKSIILPDGRCDLIIRFNAYNDAEPVVIVTGPATRAFTVEFVDGDSWVGVRLRPGFGRLLWQDRINDAVDEMVNGYAALALVPELANLDRTDVFGDALVNVIAQRASRISSSYQDGYTLSALDMIHMSGGRMGLEQLAKLSRCSSRHLNRVFRSSVGLSVKMYAQLVQFHRTLALVQTNRMPITAAALEGGYSDHAHLTRSFRRFGDIAPSNLPDDLTLPKLFG